MKKIGLIICFFFLISGAIAQETYTVDGETLQLKTEVEGKLDLLWNIIDGNYRYFVRSSDNTITELVSTKTGGHYQSEYKTVLEKLTNISANNVNLTLVDLKDYIDQYNLSQDSNYTSIDRHARLQLFLEAFGGITNTPFIENTDNTMLPQFGLELEIDAKPMSRHALFLQLRHVFESNSYKYSTTELALGYKFRIIKSRRLNIFAQTKFATLNFVKNTVLDTNDLAFEISETVFDIPFTFGVGADIRLSEQSFLTIRYNELFAALIDNQDNFSTNLTLGYKFNL